MLPAEVSTIRAGPLSLPLLREKEQKSENSSHRRQGRFEHEISLTKEQKKSK